MQNSDKGPNLIDSSDIISKKIFVAIKESGKTKEEISKFIGVNPETIRNWEKGNSSPNYTQLLKLMEVTGKGPQYFFDYENHNTQKEKQALEIKGELTIMLYTIQILYSGNDWMFICGLMFLCDGKPISIKPVGDPNRSVGNEFSSTRVNESQLFYLPDSVVLCVKSASEIVIRLIGENFYHEKYLDSADLGHLKFYYTFIDTGVIKKQQSTR